jgi:cytochrome aa3-600 menaquinol oxidase subunit 1
MPKNSGVPFLMGVCFFVAGFGFTFGWMTMGILGLLGVGACLVRRSLDYHTDYYIPVDEIRRTEAALGRL